MQRQIISSVLGLCLLTTGCTLIQNGARTLVIEPLHYCTSADTFAEQLRNHLLANNIWYEITECHPDQIYSKNYERGFKDGFVDYMAGGGIGSPPAVPHRRYWKIHYQNPRGYQAMQDWLAGFSHGTSVAREHHYVWTLIPQGAGHWEVTNAEGSKSVDLHVNRSADRHPTPDEPIGPATTLKESTAPASEVPTDHGNEGGE